MPTNVNELLRKEGNGTLTPAEQGELQYIKDKNALDVKLLSLTRLGGELLQQHTNLGKEIEKKRNMIGILRKRKNISDDEKRRFADILQGQIRETTQSYENVQALIEANTARSRELKEQLEALNNRRRQATVPTVALRVPTVTTVPAVGCEGASCGFWGGRKTRSKAKAKAKAKKSRRHRI